LVLTFSRLPLTAWFALPALLLPGVRRARRAEAGGIPPPVVASER
jgi:hypothetical protein